MTTRLEKDFVRMMLPAILIPMIRKGYLREEHLTNTALARAEIKKRLRFATMETRYHLAVEAEFAEEALSLWKRGKTWPAVTLFATAIEQCLNIAFRVILEAKGYKQDHITAVIRTHNIDAKLTWLWEMNTGFVFSKELVARTRKLFEIRNSIVHFKSLPEAFDEESSSSSRIDKEIQSLRPFHMNKFFYKFEVFCFNSMCTCDPAIALAVKIAEKFYEQA